MHKKIATLLAAAFILAGVAAAAPTATLRFIGRSTIVLTSAAGKVLYIDPFGEGDYSRKADLVLVTHGHGDHNAVSLVALAPKAVVAGPAGSVELPSLKAVKEGDSFEVAGFKIKAVPAYNKNHPRAENVGYVVTFDGISVYHAGDTNYIPEMAALAALKLDYALFPTDDYWNMGGIEAGTCADAVKARFVAAIHSSPDAMYDAANAAKLARPNAIPLAPGAVIELKKAK